MLYYIIKFIKLMWAQPKQFFEHCATLKEERYNHRVGQCVNQVAFVSFKYFSGCFVCHQSPVSSCDKPHCIWKQLQRIVEHLDKAVYTIDVAIYMMDSPVLGEALRRATKRGVRVRLLSFRNYGLLRIGYRDCILVRRLTPTRNQPHVLSMHHKFCVIDGNEAKRRLQVPQDTALTIAMTGSMNWESLPRSCDDMLITSAPAIAEQLEEEFERIWNLCRC